MIFYPSFSSVGLVNSYLLGPNEGGDAVIIDPGNFDTSLLKVVEDNKLYIRYILLTHSHDSHIRAIRTIKKIYDTAIYSYRQSILDFQANKLRDYMKIKCGIFEFEVFETPGHTGDSLIFRLNNLLFTGDTLFAGSIGPSPDEFARRLLISSIRDKILSIDENLYVFPGHGPPTNLDIEKQFNTDLKEKL
jgi:glyoxylase-like metal-dependent hydrolase (beta-lactamase superfamily II)